MSEKKTFKSIMVVAGELSGDQVGESIVRELKNKYKNADIFGVVGPNMRSAGCREIGDIKQLSVMGVVEVIKHLPRILKFKKYLVKQAIENKPDLFIGIDSPDFNLRLSNKFFLTLSFLLSNFFTLTTRSIDTVLLGRGDPDGVANADLLGVPLGVLLPPFDPFLGVLIPSLFLLGVFFLLLVLDLVSGGEDLGRLCCFANSSAKSLASALTKPMFLCITFSNNLSKTC